MSQCMLTIKLIYHYYNNVTVITICTNKVTTNTLCYQSVFKGVKTWWILLYIYQTNMINIVALGSWLFFGLSLFALPHPHPTKITWQDLSYAELIDDVIYFSRWQYKLYYNRGNMYSAMYVISLTGWLNKHINSDRRFWNSRSHNLVCQVCSIGLVIEGWGKLPCQAIGPTDIPNWSLISNNLTRYLLKIW